VTQVENTGATLIETIFNEQNIPNYENQNSKWEYQIINKEWFYFNRVSE
jgi:hypothetical protein